MFNSIQFVKTNFTYCGSTRLIKESRSQFIGRSIVAVFFTFQPFSLTGQSPEMELYQLVLVLHSLFPICTDLLWPPYLSMC